MSAVRDRMVAGAVKLLAQRGLQATSFSSVLAETSAPRGSIYHHFPGGKEELVSAAIEATQAHALHLIDQDMGASAVDVTDSFLAAWRADLHGLFGRGGIEAVEKPLPRFPQPRFAANVVEAKHQIDLVVRHFSHGILP